MLVGKETKSQLLSETLNLLMMIKKENIHKYSGGSMFGEEFDLLTSCVGKEFCSLLIAKWYFTMS